MIGHVGIKDLELVRFIVEDGSLTSAAHRMHVSQPAASQRLSNLQDRVGSELFVRVNGVMVPNKVGRRLASAASRIGAELSSAAVDIQRMLDQRDSRLRVTTQCYTCYRWLPFVISELRAKYPDLHIDVVPESTDSPYDGLIHDKVDIAVVSNPQRDSALQTYPLFEDELYAVMSDVNPLAARSFVTPANLARQTMVLYTGKKHAILEEILHPAGVSPARVIQVRITEAIVELARSGQGIAVLSGWAFDDLDNTAGLVAVRITRGGFKRRWLAVANPQCDKEYLASFVQCVAGIGATIQSRSWRKTLQLGAASASAATNARPNCKTQ